MHLNRAQHILAQCGVDLQTLLMGHLREKSRSHTKKGPGRRHLQHKPKKVS